ncbi:MAG TPA: DUF6350 family protein [Glaciibacter sp.]|nr:DUF6350 family protein [Glaciibacter sp.]
MNRKTTALLAALEALIVVAIGVGIALVPLTVVWATQFGLSVDWLVFWRAAVDVWLVGNGVDLVVQLDPAVVLALGLPAAVDPFPVTIALLGFALLAALFGVRTGMRAAETPHRLVGVVVAVIAYGVLSTLLTLSAAHPVVQPSLSQGIFLPTLIYAIGVVLGSELGHARRATAGDPAGDDRARRFIRDRYRLLPLHIRTGISGALRGGAAAAAGVITVSAVAVAVLIVGNYATVIGLYETLQAGVAGGIALTLAQLALVPNLVIWAAAWFIGPGIAIGTGTSVSPVGTALGSVPGLPILGALPNGTLALGFLGLLVPVLIGFLCAVVIRQRMPEQDLILSKRSTVWYFVATGAGIGVVAGVLLGLLAWASTGALGPGRLVDVGPSPLLVGALAAVEIGIAASAGLLAGNRRSAR